MKFYAGMERLAHGSTSVISINGHLNRNGNYLFPFREIGMRSRNYFDNGNRIEIVIVI